MRYMNAAKVAVALDVSPSTTARWARGETGDARALRRVRQLLGQTETAPPSVESGAADELLGLWTGATPPWAVSLTNQLTTILEEHRKLMEGVLRVATEEQGEDTRRLVSEEVRRALDEAERKAPRLPDDGALPVRNGSEPDAGDENGD
jgi:transcriptional regulator with XRE-family HTH domain